MNKLIAALGLTVFLVACEPIDERASISTNTMVNTPTECLDGVEYYVFQKHPGRRHGTGYMAVKFNADSTVSTC